MSFPFSETLFDESTDWLQRMPEIRIFDTFFVVGYNSISNTNFQLWMMWEAMKLMWSNCAES